MTDTIARLEAGKSIVYYTWIPYWVSGVLVPGKNVQWIEVPYSSLPDGRKDNTRFEGKNLGFAVNGMRIVANNKFLAANPAAARLFEVATLHINWVSVQNFTMHRGEDSPEDITRHVDEWTEAYQETFDSWIEAALDAS
jgi:glycine betaine/proline transport system substrate-binding protein